MGPTLDAPVVYGLPLADGADDGLLVSPVALTLGVGSSGEELLSVGTADDSVTGGVADSVAVPVSDVLGATVGTGSVRVLVSPPTTA